MNDAHDRADYARGNDTELAVKRGYKDLIGEANRRIVAWSADEVVAMLHDSDTALVDIRDVRELERDGKIPGAFHAPRGMLEFWVDPESPYHRPFFASGKRFVLYCASGWRSALATATLQDMGLQPIGHIEGGLAAWKKAGHPVAPYEHRTRADEKGGGS